VPTQKSTSISVSAGLKTAVSRQEIYITLYLKAGWIVFQ